MPEDKIFKIPSPVTAEEIYLFNAAKNAGAEVLNVEDEVKKYPNPSPVTRTDRYLYNIAVNGSKDSGGVENGTSNYNQLTNKPQINGVELYGNKTAFDLHLATDTEIYTKSEIDTKLSGKADADMVEEMQSDIASNKAALTDVVNAGKKNLLDTSKLPSVIVRDSITITSNEDGSLTISGKNETGSTIIPIANFNAGLTVTAGQQAGNDLDGLGTYIVSTGLEEDIGIGIQVCYSTTGSDAITLKSVRRSDEFEYSEEYPYVWFRLLIASDAEFHEPVTIRPMVCKKSLYDISPDFKQYAMSNAELTQKINELIAKIN